MATTLFQTQPLATTIEVVNHGRGYRRWDDRELLPVGAKNAYDRTGFEWKNFETSQGVYSWTSLDTQIAANWARGQRTSIMIADMRGGANSTYSGTYVPAYLAVAPYGVSYGGSWFPDYNNTFFQDRFDAFWAAFYAKYKNDYRVESIHVPLGQYGEWYLAGGISGYSYPSMYALKRRVDSFKVFNAGTHIRVIMMTDDEHACRYALKFAGPRTLAQPWGLARYSIGDHEHFNRLDTKYAATKSYKRLEDATAANPNPGFITDPAFQDELDSRYQVAPFETEYYGSGMDVDPFDEVIADVIKRHVSYLSNANMPYPPGDTSYYNSLSDTQKGYYAQAGRTAGYRIATTRVEVSTLEPSKPFTITTTWQNSGVAPTYERWTITYQLKSGSTIAWEGASAYDLRQLLDAQTVTVADTFTLPAISTGTYSLSILIKHGQFPTQLSALALAQNGVQSDRSALLGAITTGTTGGNVASQITEVGDPVNSAWTKEDLAINGNTIGINTQPDQPEATTGDLRELFIGVNLGSNALNSITPTVSGFTLVASDTNPLDVAAFLYRRIIQPGDSSIITVAFNASADLMVELVCSRGEDGTTPVEVSTITQSGTATTAIAAPAITPTSNNGVRRAWIAVAGAWNTSSLNADQAMTELFNERTSAVEMTLLGGTEQLGSAVSGISQAVRNWTAQYAAHYVAISSTLRAASVPTLIAPTNLVATAISTSQINLSWTAVTGAAQYQVEWATVAAGPWTVLTTTTGTTASHTGLAAATTRYYRVVAQNQPSRADSPYSATAQATTTGGVITGALVPVKTGSAVNGATGTSLSFSKPAEATAGREMFIFPLVRNSGTVAQQSVVSSQPGWTAITPVHRNNTIGLHGFRRTLTGNTTNEPATLAFTWGEAAWAGYIWAVFENQHATILDVTPVGASGGSTSTSYSAGEIAPVDGSFYLYAVGTAYANNNIVAPPNYTEKEEPKSSSAQITGHLAFWDAGVAQQHTAAASGAAASYAAMVLSLRGVGVTAIAIPAAPTSLIVSVVGTTLSATWTDAATTETGYRTLLSRDNGQSWEVAKELAAGTTSTSIAGLAPGAYRFAVEAYNSAGAARTTSSLVTVSAGTSGAIGSMGCERVQLAVFAERGGRLLATWTATADNVAWSTGERGYEDLTCFVPMSREQAKRWIAMPVLHVEVNASSSGVWEGRLIVVTPARGGIQIKATGYAHALSDPEYTAFWSNSRFKDSRTQYWRVLEEGFFTVSHPERFQVTMSDTLLITTRTNTNHGPAVVCYVTFSVPANSRNLIHVAKFNYRLTSGTGWEAALAAFDANWQPIQATSLWIQQSDPAVNLSGSQMLQIPAGAHRLAFYLRYIGTTTTTQVVEDPGRYALVIEDLRVAAVSGPVTADLIIKDVLAATRAPQAALGLPEQLSPRTDRIGAPGLDLPDACWEAALPTEVIDNLLPLGDNQTPPRRWALRVWQDGVVSFQPEGTGRRWRIKWAEEPQSERNLDVMRNVYDAIYETRRGDKVRTGEVVNLESARRWGLVRQQVLTVDTISAAQARAQRDLLLDESEDAPTRSSMEVAAVFTERGVPVPKWLVKSGDVAIPMLTDALGDDAEFVIAETQYTGSTDTLTIRQAEPIPTVETTLARAAWGIR